MRNLRSLCLGLFALGMLTNEAVLAQELYFPPDDGAWEHIDPAAAGWDAAQLDKALEIAGARNSSGVVVLHQGRILAERYWDLPDPPLRYRNYVTGHDAAGQAIEDVASAQKSVVAVITGMAQERGYLAIDDPVAKYLGTGWSQTAAANENQITIRHLLSMTSGLADDLTLQAAPGTAWRYNTPAYHLLMRAIIAATGLERDVLTSSWITDKLGMQDSAWTPRPWASTDIGVGFSTNARDLARFGLMIQAGGKWRDEVVIGDTAYLQAMLSPSQALNPAYGFLWWVNGQEFALGAGARATRSDGALIPDAPADMIAMQGAEDRKLYLVPSLNLIVTRLGYSSEVDGESFNDAFWRALIAAAPRSR